MRRGAPKETDNAPRIIQTAGEILVDGSEDGQGRGAGLPRSAIELVADPSDPCRLNLLLRKGNSTTIAPRIKYNGCVYQPCHSIQVLCALCAGPPAAKSTGVPGSYLTGFLA
jgi:hypothetical protein